MSKDVLVLEQVSMKFGDGATSVPALVDIDLNVSEGEMVAIMGASGSGKSTLLTVAGGLLPPSSGSVWVDGKNLRECAPRQLSAIRRRTLGFIFQDFNLVPSLNTLENVALPLELDGVRLRKATRIAMEALALVELSEYAGRYPSELSGGQQQRVAIARAVVGGRSLILADEPTGALDSSTSEIVLGMLRDRVDSGASCIIVTHDARHAAWADRIVFIRDGRIVDQARSESPSVLLTRSRPESTP
ncbi:ABC transporter ATP-binding protein [Galbitalea soli]|uniref:ABC transporter ATP-binding protein n=1 Tax=Galbitalea soli TaxID=1268042 RepID=A0A7C9TQD7_9MICO|nr:ABC transporter ATP-binding protein [Galbitalea soli]NEM91377.1 ABC transporter ATP-binding protein [Galbitalea soli]NYJ30068.1 putative ABC transport system ATP-binding protein [Galbitalea soli]